MNESTSKDKRFILPGLLYRGMSLIGGCVLWLASLLSFARILSGRGVESGSNAFAAPFWMIAVCLLLVLSNIGRYSPRRYVNMIAGALCCLNLPVAWLGVYFVFIMCLEIMQRPASNRVSRQPDNVPDALAKAKPPNMPLENTIRPCEDEDEVETEGEGWEEGMSQRMIRCRTEEGADRLEGTFLVEFGDDQLTSNVHVPFCPEFETVPAVEAYLLDEADAKLKVADPQLFGVRIDVKRKPEASSKLLIAVIAEANADRAID